MTDNSVERTVSQKSENAYNCDGERSRKFRTVYNNFRLNLYRRIFGIMGEKPDSLKATDFFCAEIIYLLGTPTVTEFAESVNINSSLAAYKVRTLTEGGYVIKLPAEDKRSSRLKVTDKFLEYYHEKDDYSIYIYQMFEQYLSPEEVAIMNILFDKFIRKLKETE